jgi:hypothetical protein
MNNKCIAITVVLIVVSMLAGIVATTPITTAYADESETEIENKCSIDNTSSGESDPINALSCSIGLF